MAKFLAYYNLCPTNVGKEFLGLSPDVESGSVINTLGRNMVIINKLSNQKQTKSWTVLDRLTTRVVYDSKSGQYIGIFMNRFLRRWDPECLDVNKLKKIKLRKPVSDLVYAESLDTTLVLYEDGSSEAVELAITNRKNYELEKREKRIVPEDQNITKATVFLLPNGSNMLTYFVLSPETNVAGTNANPTVELVYFLLDKVTLMLSGNINRIIINRPDQGVTLLGYTIVDGPFIPSLISIWSDNRIFIQALRDQEGVPEMRTNIGQFISMMTNLKLNQPISVVGIGQDYIAIYGASSGQEGAFLILYNTKFRIAQTKQFFKIYFNNSRLWTMGNNIFLGVGQMLSVVPFRISKEQLSDLIGSQRISGFSDYVDKEYINEEYELESGITFDVQQQMVLNASQNIDADPATINSETEASQKPPIVGNSFTSAAVANRNLKSLYNFDILVDVLRDENGLTDSVVPKIFANPRNTLQMTENFEIFASELEKCGASEAEITEKIIPALIDSNSTSDLIICLQRYSNISEAVLVKALTFAIQQLDEPSTDDSENDFTLLNQVLSCTFSRDEILSHLQSQLNITSTLFLMKYLIDFLKSSDSVLFSSPAHGDYFDSDMIILTWINIIIDSQYQKLILSSDTGVLELILDLQKLINISIEDTKDLARFLPELHNLVNGRLLANTDKYSKWYSIENIKLY